MAKFEQFEDIPIWQSSRILVKEIYSIMRIGDFSKDFGLHDQIQRASVSIMTNVAEGFERRSAKEFIQFLNCSKASVGEVRSRLYVSFDIGYIDEPKLGQLGDQATELSKAIAGFVKYLKTLN